MPRPPLESLDRFLAHLPGDRTLIRAVRTALHGFGGLAVVGPADAVEAGRRAPRAARALGARGSALHLRSGLQRASPWRGSPTGRADRDRAPVAGSSEPGGRGDRVDGAARRSAPEGLVPDVDPEADPRPWHCDKLGGWPAWEQGPAWPEHGGARMALLFQLGDQGAFTPGRPRAGTPKRAWRARASARCRASIPSGRSICRARCPAATDAAGSFVRPRIRPCSGSSGRRAERGRGEVSLGRARRGRTRRRCRRRSHLRRARSRSVTPFARARRVPTASRSARDRQPNGCRPAVEGLRLLRHAERVAGRLIREVRVLGRRAEHHVRGERQARLQLGHHMEGVVDLPGGRQARRGVAVAADGGGRQNVNPIGRDIEGSRRTAGRRPTRQPAYAAPWACALSPTSS